MWPNNKWILKHLNWSYVLVLYGFSFLWSVIVGTFLEILQPQYSDALPYEVALLLPVAAVQWYGAVWNIKHKGRSAWNILCLLIPAVGLIVFLCVRSQDQLEAEKASEIGA